MDITRKCLLILAKLSKSVAYLEITKSIQFNVMIAAAKLQIDLWLPEEFAPRAGELIRQFKTGQHQLINFI